MNEQHLSKKKTRVQVQAYFEGGSVSPEHLELAQQLQEAYKVDEEFELEEPLGTNPTPLTPPQ